MNTLLHRNIITAPAKKNEDHFYQVLDLNYLKDISGGNNAFEREMVTQFVEQLPTELVSLTQAADKMDTELLSTVAHNMKTTVSFMGLSEIMSPDLNYIESNAANGSQVSEINNRINNVKKLGQLAISDAEKYLIL